IKKNNESLRKRYGVTGFPSIIFLMPDGTPILKSGYIQVTAAQWVEVIDKKLKESLARYRSENPNPE
ncbi:MAG: hypothetical protein VX438_00835, partial [Planctomycetota bacterium]|nr:hypothetical protein [Planctomycetota bacterium]